MAAGWVKSLQCKSRAFEDVYHPNPNPNPKHLLPSANCRNSFQSIKDVIEQPKPKPKPKPSPDSHRIHKRQPPRRSESVKSKPDPVPSSLNRVQRTLSAPVGKGPGLGPGSGPFFPSVSELPEGHPSRNVVQIIFHTRWGPKPFSGRVEMVFKIQNNARAVARFEEYRDLVKVRARPDSARCVADGNEMMRFHCLGPTAVVDGGGGGFTGGISGGGKVVCTYSGSGVAHDSVGGGRGRRAMLVCRVIAGRVSKRVGNDSLLEGSVEFDSVSGDNGELFVFDARAVLPCFLVIYKL